MCLCCTPAVRCCLARMPTLPYATSCGQVVKSQLEQAGFSRTRFWTDPQQWFAVIHAQPRFDQLPGRRHGRRGVVARHETGHDAAAHGQHGDQLLQPLAASEPQDRLPKHGAVNLQSGRRRCRPSERYAEPGRVRNLPRSQAERRRRVTAPSPSTTTAKPATTARLTHTPDSGSSRATPCIASTA